MIGLILPYNIRMIYSVITDFEISYKVLQPSLIAIPTIPNDLESVLSF